MKKALVTAGTSSIGRVIVQTLKDKGYEVVVHYNTNEQVAGELSQKSIKADLTSLDETRDLIDKLVLFGKFDVIVNNAGSNNGDWERMMNINVVAPALILERGRELVNSGGVVVNISSVYGHERFGQVGLEAYSVSKAAMNSLTRTFAKKLAPDIRVNAVAPGYVASRWNEKLPDEDKQRLAEDHLTQKLVTPQEVADAVMLLVENQGIDGEIIYVDGGITLKTI